MVSFDLLVATGSVAVALVCDGQEDGDNGEQNADVALPQIHTSHHANVQHASDRVNQVSKTAQGWLSGNQVLGLASESIKFHVM